ncbi:MULTISPECIES: ion channel [Burkholderia cepacia complex]|uniref:Ion transport 2 domain protein n=1 Tax=Burkholderia orbicola (strain MC0-3) TaxID=406425 RepID=B1K173_BURO0|nr:MULTISPECIES: ion channel [Burkholderia cepacia complex]ACA90827.1 Ion transport 2 domain protein [Burkholderia orbicola MC0-3]MCA8083165.1 hypothetical protein [Burkholderia cenocepacia]HEB3532806.1 hypothetical protein [Burkholderia cenocepacia]
MKTIFNEKIVEFLKHQKWNLTVDFVMVTLIPFFVNRSYTLAEDKSPAFYILSLNALALCAHILYRTIKPKFTNSDLDRIEGVVPALYVAMLVLLLFYYTVEWYALGEYGGTECFRGALCDLQEAFYFSVSTSTTLGYGDLKPTSDAARIFACTQVITSLLYGSIGFAFLMRNIVSSRITTEVFYQERDVTTSLPQSEIHKVSVEQWPSVAYALQCSARSYQYSLQQGKPGSWTNV